MKISHRNTKIGFVSYKVSNGCTVVNVPGGKVNVQTPDGKWHSGDENKARLIILKADLKER